MTNSRTNSEPDYENCKCGRAMHPTIEDVCPKFMSYHTKLEARKSRSRNKSVADALGNFAERASKKPHKHWYMGLDKNGNAIMYPEEIGKPLHEAVKVTVETIKQTIAEELDAIIKMRSQGIWYDLTDQKSDKMNETTLTGCSVVPTRAVIKLRQKLAPTQEKEKL